MRRAIAYVALLTAGGLLLWIAGADLTNGPTDRVDDGRAGSPGETALPSTSDAGSPGSPTGAVIRGQVRRSGVARTARVELRRLAPADPLVEPLATTTTGPDGRFTFGGLEPGDYELRALEGEGRSVGAFPTVKHPGQHEIGRASCRERV